MIYSLYFPHILRAPVLCAGAEIVWPLQAYDVIANAPVHRESTSRIIQRWWRQASAEQEVDGLFGKPLNAFSEYMFWIKQSLPFLKCMKNTCL